MSNTELRFVDHGFKTRKRWEACGPSGTLSGWGETKSAAEVAFYDNNGRSRECK